MNVVTPSPEAGKKGEGPWLLSAGRWALTGRQTDRQPGDEGRSWRLPCCVTLGRLSTSLSLSCLPYSKAVTRLVRFLRFTVGAGEVLLQPLCRVACFSCASLFEMEPTGRPPLRARARCSALWRLLASRGSTSVS